jgi:hypothetical protein
MTKITKKMDIEILVDGENCGENIDRCNCQFLWTYDDPYECILFRTILPGGSPIPRCPQCLEKFGTPKIDNSKDYKPKFDVGDTVWRETATNGWVKNTVDRVLIAKRLAPADSSVLYNYEESYQLDLPSKHEFILVSLRANNPEDGDDHDQAM